MSSPQANYKYCNKYSYYFLPSLVPINNRHLTCAFKIICFILCCLRNDPKGIALSLLITVGSGSPRQSRNKTNYFNGKLTADLIIVTASRHFYLFSSEINSLYSEAIFQ